MKTARNRSHEQTPIRGGSKTAYITGWSPKYFASIPGHKHPMLFIEK
jgi:hypothetical protein